MSIPKPDLHLRISHDCKAALALLAEVEQAPESVIASRLLEDAVLGRIHTVKLAARQLSRMGFAGRDGE